MELSGLHSAWSTRARGYLELALMAAIVLAGYTIQSLVPHKLIAMNVFFLPTVAAGYCLGARSGGITALFALLIVAIYAVVAPHRFIFEASPRLLVFDLLIWGSFLGLTALAVGTLSDLRRRQVRQLQNAYVGVLEVLAKYLESADLCTKSHSVRVAELSALIAEEMGLDHDEIATVRAGALLHDIGKTEVSVDLMHRASELTQSEQREFTTTAATGTELVQSLGAVLKDAVLIVRLHNQYYGGREGQHGPAGDEIPLGARIVAVADAYDSIVTDRTYRQGRAPAQAVAEIQACGTAQFDPDVVRALRRVVTAEPTALEGELCSMESSADAFESTYDEQRHRVASADRPSEAMSRAGQ
jgi:putative nucleotidyltransferase with HDIG domain